MTDASAPIPPRVGLVGLGYWGRNLARVFHELGALAALCDHEDERVAAFRETHPGVRLVHHWRDLLDDPGVTAIVLAIPPDTHFDTARAVLESGRDVFVEKPLCHRLDEADALAELARASGRVLMVGHLLRYHAAAERLQAMVCDGTLGDIRHVEARRLNLGKIYSERNVLWNFAPHDLSLVLAVMGDRLPAEVWAHGHDLLDPVSPDDPAAPRACDVANLTLRFDGGVTAVVHVSWVSPVKESRLTVCGSAGGAVFDDTRAWAQKLEWFEGHNAVDDGRRGRGHLPEPRFVAVPASEPLRTECEHFLACCRSRGAALTGGEEARRVIAVLEAAQASIDAGGVPVRPG